MIIDHRTYNMTHGKMENYLRRYETIGLPLQKEHLSQLVGFFVSDIGPLNQVVHLWAYDSIADREIRRERMAADPRWQSFREGNHGMFASQEIKILKPASFSPLR